MEKFIILNKTAPQFVVSADIYDAIRSGTDLRLSYLDKRVDVKTAAVGGYGPADVSAVIAAAKKVWSQGYTKPSITIDLPSGPADELVMVP